MVSDAPFDPEEHWARLEAFLDDIPSALSELKDQLLEAMAAFDAFDIISNLLFANLPLRPDDYRESEHEGLIALVEYAALILLERPSRHGSGDRSRPIGKEEIDLWTQLLRDMLGLSFFAESRRVTPDFRAASALSSVRQRIVTRQLLLRNPVFDFQEKQPSVHYSLPSLLRVIS